MLPSCIIHLTCSGRRNCPLRSRAAAELRGPAAAASALLASAPLRRIQSPGGLMVDTGSSSAEKLKEKE